PSLDAFVAKPKLFGAFRQQWCADGENAVIRHPRLAQSRLGRGVVAGDIQAGQHRFFAHMLPELRPLLGPSRPTAAGAGRYGLARPAALAQHRHSVDECIPQISVVHRAERDLPSETAGFDWFSSQVPGKNARQFFGVSCLMGHDVAYGPGLTPCAGVGTASRDGVRERPPFRKSVDIDVWFHAALLPSRTANTHLRGVDTEASAARRSSRGPSHDVGMSSGKQGPAHSTSEGAVTASSALEQLPISRWHWRLVLFVGLGSFFDLYEVFLGGVLAPVLGAEFNLGTIGKAMVIAAG